MTPHVLSDAGLPDDDAQFQQFAMNAWRAPERVLSVQSSNQLANLPWNRWPPSVLAATLPRPKQPKPLAMAPIDPQLRQPDPEQAISGGQLRSLHRALKNANLVTKGEILELQRRATAERDRKGSEKRGEDGSRYDSEDGQPQMYHSDRDLREPQAIRRGS
jgi:hypothetical protein